ncbi:MAG: hypothetical protein WD056_02665 [Gemmatimonadota bacterium]
MDGGFEVMFVLILVVASILDAVARGQKKKRRMEEMDREEQGEDASDPVATIDEEDRWSGRPSDVSREVDAPSASRGSEERRETSDSMIPQDFWAILTGEATIGKEAPEVEEEVRSNRPALPPIAKKEEFPDRAVQAGRKVEPGRRLDPSSSPLPDLLPVPSREGRGSTPRRPRATTGRATSLGLPEEGGSAWTDRTLGAPPEVRSRRRPSPYAKLLLSANHEDVRQAVVLTEILGPPVALRTKYEPWEMQ